MSDKMKTDRHVLQLDEAIVKCNQESKICP